ncbi:hypothetical protein [Acidithiobacillus caldus]|uniref:Conjugal transfer protein TraB n=1 Tax=Acidithiobacillus caldus TaxID=33059 RepID=A0A1E7YKJ8_9PROT|nr:hypothetical protein [Acidithiobacillus caldus]OFC30481.1 hypothetical protein BAE27_11720 [Acidithiobacillus caldus]OFC39761.1 hypothetical protein BAE28_02550 [Acidithiobacillus caldus]OFC41474.1 hypothetical protein BAE29_02640 [Acidithiobacillus caldus]
MRFGKGARVQALGRLVLWVAGGCALGAVCWGDLGQFVLLPILAMGYGLAARKVSRAAWMLGYFLGGSWTLLGVFNAFWPAAAPWLGLLMWPAVALLLVLPWWLIGAVGRETPWVIGMRFLLSLCITAVPPLGAWSLLSPLFVAGVLFPGQGLLGLVLAALVLALWSVFFAAVRGRREGVRAALPGGSDVTLVTPSETSVTHAVTPVTRSVTHLVTQQFALGVLLAIMAVSLIFNVLHVRPVAPVRFVGVNLRWKALPKPLSFWRNVERQRRVTEAVLHMLRHLPEHRVVLLPEGIEGFYFPNWLSNVWTARLQAEALARRDEVLVGAYDISSDSLVGHRHAWRYVDALNAYGKHRGVYASRQPVPLGEWKPWENGSARAFWWETGPDDLGGMPFALSVCYSQLLVWPTASYFLTLGPVPKVILAPENHDWERTPAENGIQQRALQAWARLYGVPAVVANDTVFGKGV